MTGPRPAGRPWTPAEVAQLHELVASGVKVGLIARKLERSPGAIYARISSFKKKRSDLTFDAKRLSLPSERLALAHAKFQSDCLVELGLKAKGK
jgi:predicted site-specific integrase-resolvase